MKVLAALADSASLKALEFKKTVDTSSQKTEGLEIHEVVSCTHTGNRKQYAITHFVVRKDGSLVVARKNGEISAGSDVIGALSGDIVGLSVSDDDTVLAFGANGECMAITVDSKIYKFSLRPGLSTVVVNPNNPFEFASAGAEPLPDVFNVKIDKQNGSVEVSTKWQASQPPNDRLDLPERNLVSALAFLEDKTLVAVTSNGRVRVYDLNDRDGQPEEMAQASKDAIKSVAADPTHPGTFIIGDSRATVSRWSSMPVKLLGHYKGVSGSTRALSVRGPYVAIGGLDRYVRVFDIVKRQPAGKVYVEGQIWAIALQRHDAEEEEQEIDTFWNEIGSDPKRRKISSETKTQPKTKSPPAPADANSESDSDSESEPELDSDDDDSEASDDSDASDEDDSAVSGSEESSFEEFDD